MYQYKMSKKMTKNRYSQSILTVNLVSTTIDWPKRLLCVLKAKVVSARTSKALVIVLAIAGSIPSNGEKGSVE